MKRKLVMVLLLAAAMNLQACGAAAGEETAPAASETEQEQSARESIPPETGEAGTDEAGTEEADSETDGTETQEEGRSETVEGNGISVVFDTEKMSVTNKEQKELVTVEARWPFVSIEEHPEAAEKINTYFNSQESALDELADEYAGENQLVREGGEGLADLVFSIYRSYDAGRLGENSVSFVMNAEEFTGGAHPSHAKGGITFDAASGEILTLNDIFTDKDMATEFINEQIRLQTEGMDQSMFFEDYQDSIKDILTEDTWWFSDKGFTVVASEYLIAPYVAGSFEFTVPYEDFTYLKEEYRR